MISFLQGYIAIDTSHPHPNYGQACEYWLNRAHHDQFEHSVIVLPSGNPVVVITYYGADRSLPALALNHHMDVVSASQSERWTHHPFAGSIADAKIYGRGASDTKGLGAVHYFALKQLKDAGVVLQRTVHLLMVPDEEMGGEHGVIELIKTQEFADLCIGHLLDEAATLGEASTLSVKVDEKKVLQIQFIARAQLGHGSNILAYNVIHDMVRFLSRIADFQSAQKLNIQGQATGFLTSMHITSITGGIIEGGYYALNVIPDEVKALVDIRIPPYLPMQAVKETIDQWLKDFPFITYLIYSQTEERAPFNTTLENNILWESLERVINRYGYKVKPTISSGSSDLLYYREQAGIQGFGFAPFSCKSTGHTTDEHLPLNQLVEGRALMRDLIVDFCQNFSNRESTTYL